MKKKIINGILIVAALFATSTSFVSCKDNLADEVHEGFDQVAQQMDGLQSKIDEVNGKIASLESSVMKNSEDIANLKSELATLQSELSTLKGQVNQNTADIAANKAAIEALTERVAALEENVNGLLALVNNLVVGATVRATVDPVVGSINLPGYNPLFLAAYAGENRTEIEEFPVAGDDYNVYGVNSNYKTGLNCLLPNEIKVKPVGISAGEGKGDGERGLIMGLNTNNAGTLYFTLNPIGLDANQLSFDLVNSLGTVSPVTFTNVRQSSHILTPTIGKHGNEGPVEEEAENPYLYAADAQIPLSANADLAWNKEVSTTLMMEELNHDLSVIIARVKAAGEKGLENTVSPLLEDSYQLIQNFYQNWYKNLTAKQYQNLRVSYNDGNGNERIITSAENIVTAVVSPLSYNIFAQLGEFAGALQLDVEWFESVTGGMSQAILASLPDAEDVTVSADKVITVKTKDGKTYYIKYDSENKVWYETETEQVIDVAAFGVNAEDLAAMSASDIQSKLESAFEKFDAIRSSNASIFVNSAVNYINKMSNTLVNSLGGNPYYAAVTPIVLWETTNGIQRMNRGNITTVGCAGTDGKMTLYLTSPTEEYLVPAFKKYVAVKQGETVIYARLIDGADKVIDIDVPQGRSEIIYSVVDFSGYTVTKKYPINRKD